MAYKFLVKVCENCGEPLKVDKDTEVMEAEGYPPQACCAKCFVFYNLEEVKRGEREG